MKYELFSTKKLSSHFTIWLEKKKMALTYDKKAILFYYSLEF